MDYSAVVGSVHSLPALRSAQPHPSAWPPASGRKRQTLRRTPFDSTVSQPRPTAAALAHTHHPTSPPRDASVASAFGLPGLCPNLTARARSAPPCLPITKPSFPPAPARAERVVRTERVQLGCCHHQRQRVHWCFWQWRCACWFWLCFLLRLQRVLGDGHGGSQHHL